MNTVFKLCLPHTVFNPISPAGFQKHWPKLSTILNPVSPVGVLGFRNIGPYEQVEYGRAAKNSCRIVVFFLTTKPVERVEKFWAPNQREGDEKLLLFLKPKTSGKEPKSGKRLIYLISRKILPFGRPCFFFEKIGFPRSIGWMDELYL